MKIIIFGAPGAGKGTQAGLLGKGLNIPTISTGNILRAAMKDGTPMGKQAQEYVNAGHLVPDDMIIALLRERLTRPDCQSGYILDGVPRTIAQAEAMERMGVEVDAALNIVVDDETIINRLAGRVICKDCGASYHFESNPPLEEGVCDSCRGKLVIREDDAPETTRERLLVYHKETEPLKAYYAEKGKLKTVCGHNCLEVTSKAVRKALGLS